MEEIKNWLEQNGIHYTYAERGKNKYINIVAGNDNELVTVRKGTYNVYKLLETKKSDEYCTVFESSNKLDKVMDALKKRFKINS